MKSFDLLSVFSRDSLSLTKQLRFSTVLAVTALFAKFDEILHHRQDGVNVQLPKVRAGDVALHCLGH